MQRIENVEAEQSVLGTILLEGDFIKETSLQPAHFSQERHRRIFKAMHNVASEGLEVDPVTVTTELGSAVEEVGGVQYLADLSLSIPSTANFHGYERLVIDAYKLRDSRRSALYYAEHPTDENLNRLFHRLGSLQEIGIQETRSTKDILVSIFDDMNTPKEGMSGIDTGLSDLNVLTGGLQNGDLIIVAARPSMGKTAFALHLALANCKLGGVTNIFSLEMSDKQLVYRMISGLGGINGAKWRNPYKLMSPDDHRRSANAMGQIEKMSLNIYDQSGQSIFDIRAAVRKSMNQEPDKQHLVVIDYLQLIQIVEKFDRHDLAIGHMTRELKNMAREFNIPVVLLSQLSRGVEQRQDKRPMLSDLRDSGSIEQDADIVMFLYRDDYYNRDSTYRNMTEIIVAKHRNGEVGTVKTFFKKEYGTFTNMDEGREEYAI